MPIYEYLCPAGHRFEALGKFDDREVPCTHVLDFSVDPSSGETCGLTATRVPSVPSPAVWGKGGPPPTYQRPKT